jgi:Primase X
MAAAISSRTAAVEEGLNYILRHFDSGHSLFPRTIMTRKLNGQIEVWDKETTLKEFGLSNWQDCRINAYPSTTLTESGCKLIHLFATAPSMVFIDLDLQYFKNREALDRALKETLKLIQTTVSSGTEVRPTVLWTGNGYHIYLSVDGLVLENESVFAEFISDDLFLASKFMRFAEQYFTSNKQDPNHKPSVKNCLLRVPGSYNSKNSQQVKIVQEWNGYRIPIQYMLRQYRRYLIQERINDHYHNCKNQPDQVNHVKQESFNNWPKYNQNQNQNGHQSIYWIEKLLSTPLSNERKYCVWRILAPYLVNVIGLSDEKTYHIIISWLNECSKLERLSFYYRPRVMDDIRRARKLGYYPISLSNLQKDKSELYDIIQNGNRCKLESK